MLFPILYNYDVTRKTGWYVEGYEDELELFSPGYLMSMLLLHVNAIVLRKWHKTLRQLFNGVKET